MNPLSPISSLSLLLLSVALYALLLLATLSPAPVEGFPLLGVHLPRQPRSASIDRRPHCHRHLSCNFYSQCLENEFACGADGFSMTYARERCEIINRGLRKAGVGRPSRYWAVTAEDCFQRRLLGMLDRFDSNPDPQTCLAWEVDALTEMNSCYTEGYQREMLGGLPSNDIYTLVDVLKVAGDYYNDSVEAGFVNAVNTADHALSGSLQATATPSLTRVILCVQANKYFSGEGAFIDPTPEEIVSVVYSNLSHLDNTREHFLYAGPDQFQDMDTPSGLCFNEANHININTNDYHLVTWFTHNHTQDVIKRTQIKYREEIIVNAVMFELRTSTSSDANLVREQTLCGDGVRHLSEQCDYASNYPSCTLQCRVRSGHDCTVGKLEPSHCWMEVCGDGLRTRGEECDDGDVKDGDGCNSSCQIEHTTHTCATHYNKTSECKPHPAVEVPRQAPAKLTSQSSSVINARSSSSSGETIKRTVVPAASDCQFIRYSVTWLLVGLLSVSMFTLR